MIQTIEVDGTEHAVACNALTPIVYAGEFRQTKPDGSQRPKDISDAIGDIMASVSASGIPAIAPLLELFWALEKTAESRTPCFRTWLEAIPAAALDMTREDGWATGVMRIVEAAFFPSDAKVEPAPADDESAASA